MLFGVCQVSQWMQRYAQQLKRKALVYRQSIRGSFRRRKQTNEEDAQEKPSIRRNVIERQSAISINEETSSRFYEKERNINENQTSIEDSYYNGSRITNLAEFKNYFYFAAFIKNLRLGPRTIVGLRMSENIADNLPY